MLFGSHKLKSLQKELKRTGADKKTMKEWVKMYDKVQKNYPKVKCYYETERGKLEHLQEILRHMESCFIAGGDVKKALHKDVEQLKGTKDMEGHEFLVDKGNTEFELTYSRLKKMMVSLKKVSNEEMLFLHSETENLLDMITEILEQEKPDLHVLSFYMMMQSEEHLKDLPYEEKMAKINRIYESQFRGPIEGILSEAMEHADDSMIILSMNKDKTKADRIDYLLEDWIWKS